MGGANHRIGKRWTGPRVQFGRAARMGKDCLSAGADETLAQERLIEDSEYGLAPMFQSDQGSPQRLAGDEGACAIDRIGHPAIFACPNTLAEFFAGDPVLRLI